MAFQIFKEEDPIIVQCGLFILYTGFDSVEGRWEVSKYAENWNKSMVIIRSPL